MSKQSKKHSKKKHREDNFWDQDWWSSFPPPIPKPGHLKTVLNMRHPVFDVCSAYRLAYPERSISIEELMAGGFNDDTIVTRLPKTPEKSNSKRRLTIVERIAQRKNLRWLRAHTQCISKPQLLAMTAMLYDRTATYTPGKKASEKVVNFGKFINSLNLRFLHPMTAGSVMYTSLMIREFLSSMANRQKMVHGSDLKDAWNNAVQNWAKKVTRLEAERKERLKKFPTSSKMCTESPLLKTAHRADGPFQRWGIGNEAGVDSGIDKKQMEEARCNFLTATVDLPNIIANGVLGFASRAGEQCGTTNSSLLEMREILDIVTPEYLYMDLPFHLEVDSPSMEKPVVEVYLDASGSMLVPLINKTSRWWGLRVALEEVERHMEISKYHVFSSRVYPLKDNKELQNVFPRGGTSFHQCLLNAEHRGFPPSLIITDGCDTVTFYNKNIYFLVLLNGDHYGGNFWSSIDDSGYGPYLTNNQVKFVRIDQAEKLK